MTTKIKSGGDAITQRCCLVRLSIAYWIGKTGDASVVDELTSKHSTDRDVHEYHKMLISPEALKAIKSVRSRARMFHFKRTLPWLDDGVRALPSDFFFDYMKEMDKFKVEYEDALVAFLAAYPKYKGEARKRLGSLFDDADYPGVDALRRKFKWSVGVMPVPSSQDWRVDLGEKNNAEIRKSIEAQVLEASTIATRDLAQRLQVSLASLLEKMQEVEPIIRTSIFASIKELATVIPSMNISGDPKLDAMAKDIQKMLEKYTVDAVKDDAKVRKQVATEADAILAKMSAYIGGGK